MPLDPPGRLSPGMSSWHPVPGPAATRGSEGTPTFQRQLLVGSEDESLACLSRPVALAICR